MRRSGVVGLTALLLAAGVALAGAQGFTGGVRGAVRDSGGVVPGAEVALTNEGTGIARSSTSNAAGEYSFRISRPARTR